MAAAFSLGLAAGVLAVGRRLLPPTLFVRATAGAGLGLSLILAVSSLAAGGSGE